MNTKKTKKLINRIKLHHLPAALHRQAAQARPHQAHPLRHQANVILPREVALPAAHQARAAQTLAVHQAPAHQALPAHRAPAHPLTHLHLNPATLTPAKTSTRKDQT